MRDEEKGNRAVREGSVPFAVAGNAEEEDDGKGKGGSDERAVEAAASVESVLEHPGRTRQADLANIPMLAFRLRRPVGRT